MGDKKGCFKFGCAGCLALLLLMALFVGGAVFFGSRIEHQVETEELSQTLPVGVAPPGFLGADSPDAPELDISGDRLPTQRADDGPGRIELDLRIGDFRITPGPAGEPLKVKARYDTATFELTETYEPAQAGEEWVYHLEFGPKFGLVGLLGGGNRSDNPAEIEIIIPVDLDVDLVGTLGLGQTQAELGGLQLRSVHLDLGTGEHSFAFGEATVNPVESFVLRKSIGALEVEGLGNASPERAEIEQNIGELMLDLSGAWRNDSLVEADLGIGDLDLRASEPGVRYQLDRARLGIGEKRIDLPDGRGLPESAPTIRLELSGSIGEVRGSN